MTMNGAPDYESQQFRFGLRSLLLLVTAFCLIAGMFWFVSLILLFLMGALAVQIGVFLAIQRFANRIARRNLAKTDEPE